MCEHCDSGLLPPIYDVDNARRILADERRKRDALTYAQSSLADDLAAKMGRNFSAEELETAGRAVIIVAALIGEMAHNGIQATTASNILGFAGDRMMTDGRIEVPNG